MHLQRTTARRRTRIGITAITVAAALLLAALAMPTAASAASSDIGAAMSCKRIDGAHPFFHRAGTLCIEDPAPASYRGYGYLPSICTTPFPGDVHAMCIAAPTIDAYQWDGTRWRAQKLMAGGWVWLVPYSGSWSWAYSWTSRGQVGGGWAGWFVVQRSDAAAARFTAG